MRTSCLITAVFFVGLFFGFLGAGARGSGRVPGRAAGASAGVAAPESATGAPERASSARAAVSGAPAGVAEASTPARGTGVITGTVQTEDGHPLGGVLVTASPTAAAPGAPEARAASGQDGSFTLKALIDTTYSLSASLEGYEILPAAGQETQRARPGDEDHFVARPVAAIEVRVQLADGTEPALARVKASRILRRPGGAKTLSWSRIDPILRLPAGDYSLVASLGAQDELTSDPVEVSLVPGGERPSVILRIVERPGIRGRVTVPDGEGLPVKVFVLRTDSPDLPDPLEIAGKGKGQETDGEKGFRFIFRDLMPGRHVLAATRSEGRIEAFAAVEVEFRCKTQDLEIGPMDPNDFVDVYVQGPGGELLTEVLFMEGCKPTPERRRRMRSGTIAEGANAVRRPDGAFRVVCLSSDMCGHSERFPLRTLQIETAMYGKKSIEYTLPRTEPIVVQFEARAFIDVQVTGYQGSGHEGFVSVGVLSGGLPRKLDAEGRVRLGPFDPGSQQLQFRLDEGMGGRFGGTYAPSASVSLRPGSNEVVVPLPPLQRLAVSVEGAKGDVTLNLDQLDEDGAPTGFRYVQKPVREDGTVVFDRLPRGRYSLHESRDRGDGEMLLAIPGDDAIRFEPRPKNTLFVKIESPTGALAQAGLRTGDRILGIDGVAFEEEKAMRHEWDTARLRESAKLGVLRGGATIELSYTARDGDGARSDGGGLFAMPR